MRRLDDLGPLDSDRWPSGRGSGVVGYNVHQVSRKGCRRRLTQFRPTPGKTRHARRCVYSYVVGERPATSIARLGCSTEGATDMPRILMTSFMLAASIVVLTPHANAQSPNPAMLAPAAGQAGLAPSQNTALRPTYTSPRFGGTPANMKSRFGRYLSHPRVHGLS
jgi:hypothetical protein